jgi:Superfamily I DNA and RNA helicases and helicase subunits
VVVVGDGTHPVLESLRNSIRARDADEYRRALAELRRQRELAERVRRSRELMERLRAGAPALATDVTSRPARFTDRSLRAAWSWAFADAELRRILDPERAVRLEAQLDRLQNKERRILVALAADLAWQRMFQALRPEQEQALRAWTVAIRKIGKGTGKYAARHRRVARQYMGKARDAIPAWIMPMYRVAETVSPDPGAFDVVIVDEASQSGVESLFLFHLGKQVVVVGDDQQIAPEAVGVRGDDIFSLQKQLIRDLPFGELFEPTNSLFDQAKVRFGGVIALREHFRCMPEIIEFSNRIAYTTRSLIPLRQYGADRLDPIKTVYLPHGYREGGRQAINRPEADEIVERISKMCADPRYDGKTIGVVSLQGEAQARLIEQMLVERIGPQQMMEREIVCGDAYAFQGDERDVMFLSMVAATNQRPGPLANEAAKRRFNVAGSRAKDQVWLIHSVRLEDLSEKDMRRTMLEYYLDPQIEHLEELGDRDWTVLNEPFESRFEQDVYLEIRRRGYRVAPQVSVAGYRIDLVVEGAKGRLAVECDGDTWHGPDRWEADTARQRQLERCGWRFVRIRGSEFYRDREVALKRLWDELDRQGIEPGGYSSFDRWEIAEAPITGPKRPRHWRHRNSGLGRR